MSSVPYFDGIKPYTQLPFQYSLHVLESPDGELKHYEYLHTSDANPAAPLSQALKSHIGDHGSVLTWNMVFEKGRNSLLGGLLPDYTDFYEQLNEPGWKRSLMVNATTKKIRSWPTYLSIAS